MLMDSPRRFIGPEAEEMDMSLPVMRQMCDVFVRPLTPMQLCGSNTHLKGLYFDAQADVAEMALDAFNNDKGTKFKVSEFKKINVISTIIFCPTFDAKDEESNEILPFRALLNLTLKNPVLLCEIKDCKDMGDQMTSYVNPNWHYMCFKHERGECYYLDDDGGHRSGICDCASRSD